MIDASKADLRRYRQLERSALRNDHLIFRGHVDSSQKVESTYRRYSQLPLESWMTSIEDLITRFRAGLAATRSFSLDREDRRSWLEYARHQGVPMPLIDFSYSPYVALWFAVSGISPEAFRKNRDGGGTKRFRVIAVDTNELAYVWANRGGTYDVEALDRFRFPDVKSGLFDAGFIVNTLQLLPSPSILNERMQRQLGVFMYDTIDYESENVSGFEEFIQKLCGNVGRPLDSVVQYFDFPWSFASFVLNHLELMGLNGARLLGDAAGAAIDVYSGYLFNSRFPMPWDIRLPPSSESPLGR